ncbi:hypothetical protein AVEN_179068-1 [Araneus ventricosus]|uniref:Uncharacterized protein n=1 Tax=Araneus ventricosus TaxID=182803 RepID=A0A4Y2PIB5_ARAVE|nr:hypothetical protein AVEN_179068-1 [Araneus ventricosus]
MRLSLELGPVEILSSKCLGRCSGLMVAAFPNLEALTDNFLFCISSTGLFDPRMGPCMGLCLISGHLDLFDPAGSSWAMALLILNGHVV